MTARLDGPLHVVLDWNGTLLDDLSLAIRSVNACAAHFGVPPVDRERYTSLFDFPIRQFYVELGFDLDRVAFDEVVSVYLRSFDTDVTGCALHHGVVEGLEQLRALPNVTVTVLSASFEPTLQRTLAHKGLDAYFDNIVGIGDGNAVSKLDKAASLASRVAVPAERTVLIGDTSHDKAVADACGWQAHLVTCGHQSTRRLARLGVPLWDSPLHAIAHVVANFCPRPTNRPQKGRTS